MAKTMSAKTMGILFGKVFIKDGDHHTVGPYRLEDLSVRQLEFFRGLVDKALKVRRPHETKMRRARQAPQEKREQIE